MGQLMNVSGIIVNYCDFPIMYEVVGVYGERTTENKSTSIDTKVNVSTTGTASTPEAKIGDSVAIAFKEAKGQVEVPPGRHSCLGLQSLIPGRHTLSIHMCRPFQFQVNPLNSPTIDPKATPAQPILPLSIPYKTLVNSVVIRSARDIRLKIMPDGAMKTMSEDEYENQTWKMIGSHLKRDELRRKEQNWQQLRRSNEEEMSSSYNLVRMSFLNHENSVQARQSNPMAQKVSSQPISQPLPANPPQNISNQPNSQLAQTNPLQTTSSPNPQQPKAQPPSSPIQSVTNPSQTSSNPNIFPLIAGLSQPPSKSSPSQLVSNQQRPPSTQLKTLVQAPINRSQTYSSDDFVKSIYMSFSSPTAASNPLVTIPITATNTSTKQLNKVTSMGSLQTKTTLASNTSNSISKVDPAPSINPSNVPPKNTNQTAPTVVKK